MTEAELHRALAFAVIAVAAVVFVALFFVSAPYGRHDRSGWGPTLPARLGWVIMESPAVLAFGAIYLAGEGAGAIAPLVLFGLWQAHYLNRTVVFPWRMRGGKRMPLAVVAMAIVFNVANAYLNARQISAFGDYGAGWLLDPRFLCGTALFAVGWAINLRSDRILVDLRDGGYAIPRGFLFRWVSCPNYLGEIVEWLGWAIATWSLAGLSFALFTFANLAPRARSHHRWYQTSFEDYPPERRALIPLLW